MSRREITGETALWNNKCEHMVVYLLLKQLAEPRPPDGSYGAAGPVIHYIMEYCLCGLGWGSTGDCSRFHKHGYDAAVKSDRHTRSLAHSRTTVARAGNPELGKRIPSPAQGWPGNNKIINEMLNCSRLIKWVRTM